MRRLREWFPAGVWSGFGLGFIGAIVAYSASGPSFTWWKTTLVFVGCCLIQICGVAEGRKQQEEDDYDEVLRANSHASLSDDLMDYHKRRAERLEKKLALLEKE